MGRVRRKGADPGLAREYEYFRLNHDNIPDWYLKFEILLDKDKHSVKTAQGYVNIYPEDYVLRISDGFIMGCKPDIFEHLYEIVEE